LESAGYDRPREDRVAVQLTYASQRLRMATDAPHEDGFLVGIVPGRPRGVGLLRCENDTWLFTVIGVAGEEPTTDLGAMCEFVGDFAPPELLAAVRGAEPVGDPVRHKMPCSRWRRYDKARRFPEGLLVTGDAVCSFNPVYGQGMIVSALEAKLLRKHLRHGKAPRPGRFLADIAKVIDVPWEISVGGDLEFPEVDGERTAKVRFGNGYVARVQHAATKDPVLTKEFMRVAGLLVKPPSLMRPDLAFRVLRHAWHRPEPAESWLANENQPPAPQTRPKLRLVKGLAETEESRPAEPQQPPTEWRKAA
jgi:hypothetical protein